MNSLQAKAPLALTILAVAAMTLTSLANTAASRDETATRNLLTENPRLQQLLAEANRASGPEEILRLADANVDSEIIEKYVETSGRRYDLDADQIIQLHKKGVAPRVLSAMIRRDGETRISTPAPVLATASPTLVRVESPASEPASTVTYIGQRSRAYPYAYRTHYISACPYSGWWPGYYGSLGYCGEGYWNYRPAWSYDFRFRGCW